MDAHSPQDPRRLRSNTPSSMHDMNATWPREPDLLSLLQASPIETSQLGEAAGTTLDAIFSAQGSPGCVPPTPPMVPSFYGTYNNVPRVYPVHNPPPSPSLPSPYHNTPPLLINNQIWNAPQSVNTPTSQSYSSPSGSSSSGSYHSGPNSAQMQTRPLPPTDFFPQSIGSSFQPSPNGYPGGLSPSAEPHFRYSPSPPTSEAGQIPTNQPSTAVPQFRYSPSPPTSEAQTSQPSAAVHQGQRFSNQEQLRLFSVVPLASGKQFIPQRRYKPHTNSDRRRYVEDVALDAAISFESENPAEDGIALTDALRSRVRRLQHRDEPVFEGRGPSVSIRLEWPGYGQWSRQIPTKDFRSPPCPITRAKLAKNVAKCVLRFIEEKRGHAMEEDSDERWKVGDGPGQIKFDDLVLVSLHHVSMGSWQPQLRLRG